MDQMMRPEGEVIYQIIPDDDDDHQEEEGGANNDDNNNNNLPVITIRERTIYAITRTSYYRRTIPDGGMQFDDLFRMAGRTGGIMRISLVWIAAQLNRPEFGGVAGTYVAELASLYGVDLNRVADGIIQAHHRVRTLFVPRLITADETAVPGDFVCAVCLLTREETTSGENNDNNWVTADGCPFHFFHRECMLPWSGSNNNKCMTCSRPLLSSSRA